MKRVCSDSSCLSPSLQPQSPRKGEDQELRGWGCRGPQKPLPSIPPASWNRPPWLTQRLGPNATPESSSSSVSSQHAGAKPPASVWEAENEGKAQGNFSPGQGFLRTSPWRSPRKPLPRPAQKARPHHGKLSRPLLGGQEGPGPRAGAPILSPTLAGEQRPHPHTPPGQGSLWAPLTKCGAGSAGAGVGDSVPSLGARTPWWPWGDGSTPRGRAPTCRISPF